LTGGNIAFTYVFEKAKCRGNPMKKNILSPKSIQQKERSGAGGYFPLEYGFIFHRSGSHNSRETG